MRDDSVMVIIDGVRVRRDEVEARGLTLPGPAPADEDKVDETKAPAKARTASNKARGARNK